MEGLQQLRLTIPLSVATGIASHLFYFRIGEHHMLATAYVKLLPLTFAGAIACLVQFTGASVSDAFAIVATLMGSWLVGVYGSLLIYRAFFHRLNKFPGPWPVRFGDLWMSFQLKQLDGYHVFHDLHKKNGHYVRIGSNTLSITDPDIMEQAYGTRSKVVKADWYDVTHPYISMQTTRDKGVHDRRRRVWAPAFSDKALREYEPTVREFNDKFLTKIRQSNGGPVNITTLFNLYSFDIMGHLAFGKNYGMLESGKKNRGLELLVSSMEPMGYRLPVWAGRLLDAMPAGIMENDERMKFCASELRQRVLGGGKEGKKDIIGWLLKAYGDEKQSAEDLLLQADTELIIIAGSDTTAVALTFLFYHLALDPSQQTKLREELVPLTNKDDWTDKDIAHAEHLNGVCNEALRLHPPVPSGVMRKTPKEGLQVGETYIPGDITFCTPQYPMGRDERNYKDADKFLPERWYSKPEYVKHKDAFAPFSMGPFNCIGRNLSRMELRSLTTQILLNYDVAFAPGEDGQNLLTKSKDYFTMTLADLNLVFTPIAK